MKILYNISGFYKNDKPEGIGIVLDSPSGLEYNKEWEEGILKAIHMNEGHEDPIKDLPFYIEQLEAYASNKNNLGFKEIVICLANIFILEKHKIIPTNEYNGMLFHYVENKK